MVQRPPRPFYCNAAGAAAISRAKPRRPRDFARPIAEVALKPHDCLSGHLVAHRCLVLNRPVTLPLDLNEQVAALCDSLAAQAAELRISPELHIGGARVFDFGIEAAGGLEAGLLLARICLANLAQVTLSPAGSTLKAWPSVAVTTDQPVAACLASQYAGWQLSAGKFFAMGSGPMRAAGSREPLFDKIGYRERPQRVVGVLETRQLPTPEIVEQIANACQVPAANVTLLVAPTASVAGGLQIVARSVETGLHKLVELGFDVLQIERAAGHAPLPPVAKNDLLAIGRTNDAILYGGEVTYWLHGDDEQIAAIGAQAPSSASSDYGVPFREIFERYHRDFYAIDPHLFSPAVVVFENLTTGRTHRFGHLAAEVVQKSFEH